MLARRFFPLTTFEDLRGEMDRVFDTFSGGGASPLSRTRSFPAVNVWEDADSIFVEAEVPGLTMDDINVEVTGRELTIKGEIKSPEVEGKNVHRQERWQGSFSRMMTLGTDVDTEKVEAVLREGVLTITMPKSVSARARKIPVLTK